MQIGLALSGGGFRATVFHLGVLARLAEENQLENVTLVSSVSGGSLCAGLVYAKNQFQFPNSQQFIQTVLPQARDLLTSQDLELDLIWRAFRSPLNIFETKADDLSALLQQRWGLTARLRDLPAQPRWLINTTCYETGKNWRFDRGWMGDYVFGYTRDTNIPLSDAVAASSGFPGLIGALVFDTRARAWFNYVDESRQTPLTLETMQARATVQTQPPSPIVHLWDGGVYDNLGLEGLIDPVGGWRKNMDFLIASDASGPVKPEEFRPGASALYRIIVGVMMEQVRSLHSRIVVERIVNHHDQGALLQIGNTCRHVLERAGRANEIARFGDRCLNDAEAAQAADLPTAIRRLKPEEFERVFRHGFEVANYTLYAYHDTQFKFIAYDQSRWAKPGS